MEPTLAAVFICRKATPASDGMMIAERIVDGIDFESLPVDIELALVVKILDAPRPLPVTVRFYAPVGENAQYSMYAIDASLPDGDESDVITRTVVSTFRFMEPNRFRVRVFANGVDIGGTYFRVGMASRLN